MSARADTYARLAQWAAFVGVLAALNYAGRAAGADTDSSDLVYRWSSVVGGLIQFGVMLGLVLLIARGRVRELLGLRRPRRPWRAAGLVLAVVVLTLAAAAALEPLLHAGEEQGFTPSGWDGSRAAQYVANFVLIAGLVPIVEELLFRGLGYAVLLPVLGGAGAIVANGLAFGLAHGLVRGLPVLAVFGIGLAWLRRRTDSVVPCVACHALFNGFALIVSVAV